MEASMSTSAGTIRSFQHDALIVADADLEISQPSSPVADTSSVNSHEESSADSVSSFPSVSSSFFFSSASASPHHHHSHPQSDHGRDAGQALVIPSLTLPTALRHPTPHGQAIGDVRVLVVGCSGIGKTVLANLLVDGNEDVVETEAWDGVDGAGGSVLRASTSWFEHRDAHGLEKFEGSKNIEIKEIRGFSQGDDAQEISDHILSVIQAPFHSLQDVLNSKSPQSQVLRGLVSSPATPLYTALIFMLSTPPTSLERNLLDTLGPHVPIIALPPSVDTHSPYPSNPKLSSFRPKSAHALRSGLFRSPETLAALRSESAERFLQWREIERAVGTIRSSRGSRGPLPFEESASGDEKYDAGDAAWSKAEWEASLSEAVARRLHHRDRERTVGAESAPHLHPSASCTGAFFDPLHIPSILMFSLSLFAPLRVRAFRAVSSSSYSSLTKWVGGIGIALIGAFCAGIGFGMAFG